MLLLTALRSGHGKHGLVDGRGRQVKALLEVQMLEERLLRVLILLVRVGHGLQRGSAIRLLVNKEVFALAAREELVVSRSLS